MIYYVAIWCFLALTLSITADEGLGLGGLGGLGGSGDWSGLGGLVYAPKHASADYYAYPRYAFEYAVKDPHTGDNKAQWEKRDGDVVKGAYSLVEPDGSLRIVEYWADDKSGFNAVVKRVGPSLHPATVSAAPIYKAPIPVISSATITSPLSIGPVANLGGLASAPLITGSLGQGGVSYSSASLIKAPPMAVAAAPIAPVYSAPIVKSAPLEAPIGPMLPAPVYSPILKSPILQPDPILKNPQIWSSLGAGPIYSGGAPLIKGIPDYGFGDGLMKGGLGGYDIGLGLDKGAMLPPLLGSWGLPLGLKQ